MRRSSRKPTEFPVTSGNEDKEDNGLMITILTFISFQFLLLNSTLPKKMRNFLVVVLFFFMFSTSYQLEIDE